MRLDPGGIGGPGGETALYGVQLHPPAGLPADVQQSVAAGHLSFGHARVLAGLQEPKNQKALYRRILEKDSMSGKRSGKPANWWAANRPSGRSMPR